MGSNKNLPDLITDLPSPCFLVDLNRAKLNTSRMLETCKKLGVQLRPHMKTHKTIELAVLQTGGKKQHITVSTIQEAEFYAENGFDDILYAYPITADKITRCVNIANSHNFHVLFDSHDAIEALSNAALDSGKKWSVLLSVDTGDNREGALWNSEDAVELVKKVVSIDTIRFQGLYTHDGHAYECKDEEELRKSGDETVEKIQHLKNRLQKEGIDCITVGLGSTPSCAKPSEKFSAMTELHPGNYIFFDYEQYMGGVCGIDEIACRVMTRVISHCPSDSHLLVDCGFTAISHDGMTKQDTLPFGFCIFQDNPNLRMVNVNQEVGIVKAADGKLDFGKYPIGTILYIYPFHSCAAAAMHPVYYVHEGDKVVGMYKPTRGW
ncbi:D-threo-3-hydroxyaspartate dehydratase-like [Gigantopelta aegis]|uniref:D-threo-3-hydroxyaspartate dehydratase-like n=1 Tax=Gigantopelta aegis TaxID=1735272 RepID=UPI001B88B84E|nr:D-threo-3-hydroxyaspartate dehydratase-like [Gigantopelta aegis]XP_041352166.1 D-threo-3-hydroxyaspartate dehydratase-like [Gigantopelta aegis]XP_041352167.1 D-threo-3-hydroxyaspartate dehydratase-like [Gigantopelta aegis]XP_041352168.1 D-threo-3-hydroxyaspartate dehydratase-like [Gigantopelta aegis]